ncbi:MAG: sulfite exporter TauE/SafE family protein [Candidatus Vogelbacteria bacterium]|nr:sulfite exporter TauE/SafE family protein [Candidatus Vogelbacteria bacterium]
MITTKVPLSGMHCKSCALLIEDKIKELPEVRSVHVDFRRQEADIRSEVELGEEKIAAKVRAAGYSIGVDDKRPWISLKCADYHELAISFVVLVALYFVLLKTGWLAAIAQIGSGNPQSLAVVVLLGVTAGFSTCMAVVGGLLLAVSARHAEKHPNASVTQKFRPHLFFNLGRIISYFILGGLIGWLGSVLSLTGGLVGFLTLLVGLVMLILGLQLIEIFPRLSRLSLSLPPALARFLGISGRVQSEYSHKGAIVAGALTFFLPCGFTQAMQLFAVSTGSFWSGALIMGAFALGTAPGLLSLGGLTSLVKGKFARHFYKFTGLVVIVFAFITLSNGYVLSGLKSYASNWSSAQSNNKDYQSLFNSYANQDPEPAPTDATPADLVDGVQVIKTTFVSVAQDITPKNFVVKAGQPVRLLVGVKENGQGCMSTIMVPGLYNTPIYLEQGKTLALDFTPTRPGTYDIACAMGVVRGKITVKSPIIKE